MKNKKQLKVSKKTFLCYNKYLTLSKGKKNAEALDVLLPAFKATALPCQSITGEPLEPPFVPEAACVRWVKERRLNWELG